MTNRSIPGGTDQRPSTSLILPLLPGPWPFERGFLYSSFFVVQVEKHHAVACDSVLRQLAMALSLLLSTIIAMGVLLPAYKDKSSTSTRRIATQTFSAPLCPQFGR